MNALFQQVGRMKDDTGVIPWYNTSIIFHSPDLLKQRIHFRFPRTTSLEEVVQALNDLGIAKLEQKKGKVIISDYSPKH